jgi:hypothetical protein
LLRVTQWKRLLLKEKSKFARGTVGTEVVGKMEGGSAAGGDGGEADGRIRLKSAEGKEAGGLVEAETGAELACGGAEDAAAEGGIEGAEAIELDRDGGFAGGGADGAASTTDWFAWKEELGEDAG